MDIESTTWRIHSPTDTAIILVVDILEIDQKISITKFESETNVEHNIGRKVIEQRIGGA